MSQAETGANAKRRILYCHCAYAQVVPADVKAKVLEGLSAADVAFDAVPDLCELAARRDKGLERLAGGNDPVDIVACYPRAVRWLFHAADAALAADDVRIHNMRSLDAETVLDAVLSEGDAAGEEDS